MRTTESSESGGRRNKWVTRCADEGGIRHLGDPAILELSWDDYTAAMRRCSDRGRRSGAVYDTVHLAAAERWSADVLLTFNVQDFTRLSVESGPRILAPPDPPGVHFPSP